MITAVRLRLLPGAARRRSRWSCSSARARGGLRGDRSTCSAAGCARRRSTSSTATRWRSSAARIRLRRRGRTGCRRRRGCAGRGGLRADRRARRQRGGGRGAAARGLLELLGGRGARGRTSRSSRRALWRWRDGFNPAFTGVRGAKVSEDVVVPIERLARGARALRRDRRAPRPALVRLGSRRRGQRARDGACRPAPRGGAGRGRGGRWRSCTSSSPRSAARSPASTASGCSSAGASRAQWYAAGGRAARADQARLRPEGPVQPRQEARPGSLASR